MCGIAGIFSLNSEAITDINAIKQMSKAMVSRGPNDEGYLTAFKTNKPLASYKKETFNQLSITISADLLLAHRRLSIMDLSLAGHQPMISANQRYAIVYNGEIYNFKELSKELISYGFNFTGHSDTEVLLAAYQQWGEAAFQKFNGMFALAIWDDQEKTLLCARDRIGIKPFYYTIQDNKFIFASDIKTLIASGLYQPDYDLEGLYHVVSYGVAPRPLTAFKDVHALEQGYLLRINANGQFKKTKYWELPIGTQQNNLSEKAAIELLEEKLITAVDRRLVADVPVGTFMSGGIDSTTISALAAKAHPGIQAFTLGYESAVAKEFDEVEQAKQTAAMYDMQHIIHNVSPDCILDAIDDTILCYEEPYYSLSPNYIISRLVAEHGITVILNGLGGDELFAGYRHYKWGRLLPLLRIGGFFTQLLGKHAGKFERASDLAKANTYDKLYNVLFANAAESFKQRLFLSPEVKQFNSIEKLHSLYANNMTFDDPIEAMNYMDIKHYIGNHHVYRVDQFTMRFSLEGRFPFLDHEVVEAAFRIPSRYKIKDGVQKYVLRKVAEKYISPTCLSMKKKGFGVPMNHWLHGVLADYVAENFNALGKRDIFSKEMLDSLHTRFKQRKIGSTLIWQLVSIERWLQLLID